MPWDDQDRVIPHHLVDDLVELHPAWELRSVKGVGHLLAWEAPQTYVELVRDWVTGPA